MSENTTRRSAEEAAVRGLYQQFMDAWTVAAAPTWPRSRTPGCAG